MGKMSELDLVKQDIQQISDDIESSRPEIYEESSQAFLL